jgi:acetyl-CoA synthetase
LIRGAAVFDVHNGTTGKPKGCQHRTGGYLAYAAGTGILQDIHAVMCTRCMADIGWITGHSTIVRMALSGDQRFV